MSSVEKKIVEVCGLTLSIARRETDQKIADLERRLTGQQHNVKPQRQHAEQEVADAYSRIYGR
jgi:hypothetical protein